MVSVGGAKRSGGGSRGRPTEAAGALNSPGTGGSRPRGDRAEQADRCAPLRRAGGDDDRRGADPGTPAGRDPGEDHRRGRRLPRRPHPRGDVPGGTQAPVHPRLRAHRNRGQAGCPRNGFELGQRVGAITVYGSHADYLCVPQWWLVPVPDRLDPAEAAIVVFNYLTAHQMLHRTAAGAGRRTGPWRMARRAVWARPCSNSGAWRASSFTERVPGPRPGSSPPWARPRSTTPRAASSGASANSPATVSTSCSTDRRSCRPWLLPRPSPRRTAGDVRALRHHRGGRKSARRVALFYLSGALVFAGNLLPDGKRVRAFQVAKLRDRHPEWFREDATTLFRLLAEGKIEPIVAEARRAHENLGRGGVTGKQVLICDEETPTPPAVPQPTG